MRVKDIKRYRAKLNRPIQIADYELSIQASAFHYCTPKEFILDMGRYSSVEFVIWNKTGMIKDLRRSRVLGRFPQVEKLMSYANDGNFNFVPVTLLDAFLDYLQDYYQEKAVQKGT